MAKEYNPKTIKEKYYTILVLDCDGAEYDEIYKNNNFQPFTDIKDACKKAIQMIEEDREYRKTEFSCIFDYRVILHEVDDDTDWQTEYKVYKYKGQWKYKLAN